MHDRLAHNWLRQTGIMATCAANARLEINGAYYGLFVVEEDTSGASSSSSSRRHPDGDLWKGGRSSRRRTSASPTRSRRAQFWAATDLASMSAIVDIDASLKSWAAEAVLNNGDGYYGGAAQLPALRSGAEGIRVPAAGHRRDVRLSGDARSAGRVRDHPVFWWEGRAKPAPVPGQHWLIVMSDADMRRKYADAIADAARSLGRGAAARMDRHLVAADRGGRRGGSAHLGDAPAMSRPPWLPRARWWKTRARVPTQLRGVRARRRRRRPRRRWLSLVRRLPRR